MRRPIWLRRYPWGVCLWIGWFQPFELQVGWPRWYRRDGLHITLLPWARLYIRRRRPWQKAWIRRQFGTNNSPGSHTG